MSLSLSKTLACNALTIFQLYCSCSSDSEQIEYLAFTISIKTPPLGEIAVLTILLLLL